MLARTTLVEGREEKVIKLTLGLPPNAYLGFTCGQHIQVGFVKKKKEKKKEEKRRLIIEIKQSDTWRKVVVEKVHPNVSHEATWKL